MLSKTEPVDLGKGSHKSIKAYLIGEVKLSLKTFYNAYKTGGGYNRNQFRQIVQFADDRVYTKTAVFLALLKGNKTHRSGLTYLMNSYAIPKGVIPVVVSAQ